MTKGTLCVCEQNAGLTRRLCVSFRYFCLQMFPSRGDLQHAAGGDAQPQHQRGGGGGAGTQPAGSAHSRRYVLKCTRTRTHTQAAGSCTPDALLQVKRVSVFVSRGLTPPSVCLPVFVCCVTVALGYSVPTVPNGVTRIPSVGEAPSHPSTRHPSVASTRLPSVGEESTHPLLVAEDAVRPTRLSVDTQLISLG